MDHCSRLTDFFRHTYEDAVALSNAINTWMSFSRPCYNIDNPLIPEFSSGDRRPTLQLSLCDSDGSGLAPSMHPDSFSE